MKGSAMTNETTTTATTANVADVLPTFAKLCDFYGRSFVLRVVRQYVTYYDRDLDFALDVADDYAIRGGDDGPADVLTTLNDANELNAVCELV